MSISWLNIEMNSSSRNFHKPPFHSLIVFLLPSAQIFESEHIQLPLLFLVETVAQNNQNYQATYQEKPVPLSAHFIVSEWSYIHIDASAMYLVDAF